MKDDERTPAAVTAAPPTVGAATADRDLKAQVDSLVEVLHCVAGNVEGVLDTLRRCTVQLQAIASRRKQARSAARRRCDARHAVGFVATRGAEPSTREHAPCEGPAPPPPAALRRRGGAAWCGGGGAGGGCGLDDAHELDWDACGLELGHALRSPPTNTADGCNPMTTTTADVAPAAAAAADETVARRSEPTQPPPTQPPPTPTPPTPLPSTCVGEPPSRRTSDYEEDMEHALERSSSCDCDSDDDEAAASDSSDAPTSLWSSVECGRCQGSRRSPPDHRDLDCGSCSDHSGADGERREDDDRAAYDPSINTWRSYALTCAEEDRN